VYAAVEHQMRAVGAAAGRGAYASSVVGGNVLQEVRRRAAQLFRSPSAGHWIMSANGTSALNQAIHGVMCPGDHVVSTAADHNSVLRPLEWLKQKGKITTTIVACDRRGAVSPQAIAAAVRPETRLVAVTHASNVTGAINSMNAVCEAVRNVAAPECLILFDAAQTAGLINIDIGACEVDLLAMPGHKGLGGPLGTALLYVGPRAAESIEPLFQGGTGSQSDSLAMPAQLPGKLESGNQNVPAIAGLAAGLEILQATNLEHVAQSNKKRVTELAGRLESIEGLQIMTASELPILSVKPHYTTPHELAAILDSEFGIETRAGLHCAPLIHQYLGTAPDGTLRVSFSASTSDQHLQVLVDALAEIVTAFA
jgi:cysteine desulfurase / selenocysteine lyase